MIQSTSGNLSILPEFANLLSRFESLVDELTDVLSEKGVGCDYVVGHLLNSPPESIGEHVTVLLNNMAEMPSNTPISQFMKQLKQYIRFLDCNLLKAMTSALPSVRNTDLPNKIAKYESDVKSFCQSTSVSSFAKTGYTLCSYSEDIHFFTPMQVRCTQDPDEYTLADLAKQKQSLSEQLCIGFSPAYLQKALILYKVELSEGSHNITWLVPCEMVPHLMNAEADPTIKMFFDKHKINIFFDVPKSDTSGSTSPAGSSWVINFSLSKLL